MKHWRKLPHSERQLAINHAKGYQAASKNQTRPTSVKNYLMGKRWQGLQQKASKVGGEVRPKVFVEQGTPAYAAWTRHRGKPFPPSGRLHKGKHGWWADSEYPPVLEDLAGGERVGLVPI
ncbi:MAG: hypothetical protein JKY10_07870 [Cohaesibacteraceae bacterium]|nr:hypothetical protein [Cohaesibacteraceae bacterium]